MSKEGVCPKSWSAVIVFAVSSASGWTDGSSVNLFKMVNTKSRESVSFFKIPFQDIPNSLPIGGIDI